MSDRTRPPRKTVLELVPIPAPSRGLAKTSGKALVPCPCCRGVGIVTLDARVAPANTVEELRENPAREGHLAAPPPRDDPDPEAA